MVITAEYVSKQIEELQKTMENKFSSLEMKITSVQQDIANLRTNVENHKVEIQNQIDTHKKEIQATITKQVAEAVAEATEQLRSDYAEMERNYELLKSDHQKMLKRSIDAEDRSRRLNMVIRGLKEEDDTPPEKLVSDFFAEKLNVPSEVVKSFQFRNIHFLGKPQQNKDRSIIVAFLKQTDRNYIMRRGYLLKDSNITMKSNYSPETTAVKDNLMMIRKKLNNDGSGRRFRVVDIKYYPTLQMETAKGKWSNYTPRKDSNDDEDEDFHEVLSS